MWLLGLFVALNLGVYDCCVGWLCLVSVGCVCCLFVNSVGIVNSLTLNLVLRVRVVL